MTIMSILPIASDGDGPAFRAVAGEKQSTGRTIGEALDALAAQFTAEEADTFLVVRERRGDRFFGEIDQGRLADLMDRWRAARDRGEELAADAQRELDELVEAELQASGERGATFTRDCSTPIRRVP